MSFNLIMHNEDIITPNLINFADDNFANLTNILIINIILLNFTNFLAEIL